MTDNDIVKAIDILEKFEFFGGQRAGRELWFEKPVDVQNMDIESFSKDIVFLKKFINRQKAKIERLIEQNVRLNKECDHYIDFASTAKAEAVKEFADRLRKMSTYGTINISPWQLDNLVKEMTEGN